MVVLSKMDKMLKKKLIKIAETLPDEKIKEIINSIEEYLKNKNVKEMIEEDREWLNSNLTDFPEFDWGTEEPPKGKPVKYIKDVGIVVKNNNSSRN